MLEKVKLALRIATNAFDTDITDMISACKLDLKLSGVNNTDDADELVARAIIFYCRAYFSPDDTSNRYEQAYHALKVALSLCSDYTEVE